MILLAYEWSKRSELAQPTAKELEPPAPHGELEGLIEQLNGELDAEGLFPPAVADRGDQEHPAYHLHQDRLVVARSEGDPRRDPGACRTCANSLISNQS